MNEVAITSPLFHELRNHLAGEDEAAAILLGNVVDRGTRGWKLLINEARYAVGQDYAERSSTRVVLRPSFVAAVAKEARNRKKSLIFVHTHPHSTYPRFSATDDQGEHHLARFVHRVGPFPHAALVLGQTGCAARLLGSPSELLRVAHVGSDIEYPSESWSSAGVDEAYDRQVRAFGSGGQTLLGTLCIGIIGLGGTGSLVAQQLAHLGVREFLLLDPDSVDASNLNRLAGARRHDIGVPKVVVAARHIRRVRRSTHVEAIRGSVLQARTARRLAEADFLFCCTDSHGSRAVINQLAYQYLIPCIDMGVSLTTGRGQVTHIAGRVQMLAPGLACLACGNLLDPDAVRRDLMSEEERLADPYFLGDGEAQPAVMSLNGTVASLAVTMFLGATVGVPAGARFQLYNGIAGTVRTATAQPDPVCVVCSARGAMGRGDDWPLPARQL